MPDIQVNQALINGATSLFLACMENNLAIVERLLRMPDIQVNQADNYGRTPLFDASRVGGAEVVERLLSAEGIQVNQADNDGRTPLFVASRVGGAEVVERLLRAPGIDVNQAEEDGGRNHGVTPLETARNKDIAKKLIWHGAEWENTSVTRDIAREMVEVEYPACKTFCLACVSSPSGTLLGRLAEGRVKSRILSYLIPDHRWHSFLKYLYKQHNRKRKRE